MSNYTGKRRPFHSQGFFPFSLINKQNTGNSVSEREGDRGRKKNREGKRATEKEKDPTSTFT